MEALFFRPLRKTEADKEEISAGRYRVGVYERYARSSVHPHVPK